MKKMTFKTKYGRHDVKNNTLESFIHRRVALYSTSEQN